MLLTRSVPTGVAHTNKDSAGNNVGCYDAGALRITANPVPHLKVVKTPDGDSFSQGGAVSFTIVVTNDGDAGSVATNVQLSDQLPTAGGLNWSGAIRHSQPGVQRQRIQLADLHLGFHQRRQLGDRHGIAGQHTARGLRASVEPDRTGHGKQAPSAPNSGSLTCTPIPHLKVVKTPDGGSFSQGGASASRSWSVTMVVWAA